MDQLLAFGISCFFVGCIWACIGMICIGYNGPLATWIEERGPIFAIACTICWPLLLIGWAIWGDSDG